MARIGTFSEQLRSIAHQIPVSSSDQWQSLMNFGVSIEVSQAADGRRRWNVSHPNSKVTYTCEERFCSFNDASICHVFYDSKQRVEYWLKDNTHRGAGQWIVEDPHNGSQITVMQQHLSLHLNRYAYWWMLTDERVSYDREQQHWQFQTEDGRGVISMSDPDKLDGFIQKHDEHFVQIESTRQQNSRAKTAFLFCALLLGAEVIDAHRRSMNIKDISSKGNVESDIFYPIKTYQSAITVNFIPSLSALPMWCLTTLLIVQGQYLNTPKNLNSFQYASSAATAVLLQSKVAASTPTSTFTTNPAEYAELLNEIASYTPNLPENWEVLPKSNVKFQGKWNLASAFYINHYNKEIVFAVRELAVLPEYLNMMATPKAIRCMLNENECEINAVSSSNATLNSEREIINSDFDMILSGVILDFYSMISLLFYNELFSTIDFVIFCQQFLSDPQNKEFNENIFGDGKETNDKFFENIIMRAKKFYAEYLRNGEERKGNYQTIQTLKSALARRIREKVKHFLYGKSIFFRELESRVSNKYSIHGYTVKIVGHSLGAIVAELISAKENIPCLTFESPGSLELLKEFRYYHRIAEHRVVNFISAPNYFNTLYHHVGRVYRMKLRHTDGFSFIHAFSCALSEVFRVTGYLSIKNAAQGLVLVYKAAGASLSELAKKQAAEQTRKLLVNSSYWNQLLVGIGFRSAPVVPAVEPTAINVLNEIGRSGIIEGLNYGRSQFISSITTKFGNSAITIWGNMDWFLRQHSIKYIKEYLQSTDEVWEVDELPILSSDLVESEIYNFLKKMLPFDCSQPGIRTLLSEENMREIQIMNIKGYQEGDLITHQDIPFTTFYYSSFSQHPIGRFAWALLSFSSFGITRMVEGGFGLIKSCANKKCMFFGVQKNSSVEDSSEIHTRLIGHRT